MTTNQASTSTIPSRASSAAYDSIEPGQSSAAPSTSSLHGVYATPSRATPSNANARQQDVATQISMQDVITIEHGEEMRFKCVVHEQLLCRYSAKMKAFSAKAAALREAYNSCDDYLERMESLTMAELSSEQSEEEEEELMAKLVTLIVKMEQHYPLRAYQGSLNKTLRVSINGQFSNGNTLQSAELPKTLNLFQGWAVNQRLEVLNLEGLLEVAEDVHTQMQKFKLQEKQLAKNNVVKSWAQGRLRIRDASRKSAQSLADWLYSSKFDYDDAEHLYDIWKLAVRLDVEILVEVCMNQLFHVASASISNALSDGVPLYHLLRPVIEPDMPDSEAKSEDVVTTVFRHVLEDKDSPIKLSELVIETMAKGMDAELWSLLQTKINHDTARKLIGAMVACRHVKEGAQDRSESSNIKCEHQSDLQNIDLQPTGAH